MLTTPLAKNVTLYKDINQILKSFALDITNILQQDLIGLYLTGSLTYNDFDVSKSDIDLCIVLNQETTKLQAIKDLHKKIEKDYPVWGSRLECSYISLNILKSKCVPENPRPYYNCGNFFDKAYFGNEWLINNYLLYHHGIALIGPDFKELIDKINELEVKQACIKDLFDRWVPKTSDQVWLKERSNLCYFILNLCRILHSVIKYPTGSKTIAATWIKNQFPQWDNLISKAEKHDTDLNVDPFIKFVLDKVSKYLT